MEASQPLNLSWGAFTNGTTNDFILVNLNTPDGLTVAATPALFEPGALNGTNLTAQFPSGVLQDGTTYQGSLLFLKRSTLATNYPGAKGLAGYFRQTDFPVVTLPSAANRIQFAASSFLTLNNSGTANIGVTRSGSVGSASVDFTTRDGTATGNLQYQPSFQTIYFADGETMKTVPIVIWDNRVWLGNHTVNLQLTNPQGGAELGNRPSAVLNILNQFETPNGIFEFTSTNYSVSEKSKAVTITVKRGGANAGTVKVFYYTLDGTATNGQSYILTNGVLVFGPGTISKTFLVQLLDNSIVETNKFFYVFFLGALPDAGIGTNYFAQVNILNDDLGGVFAFKQSNYVTNENNTNFVITVVRTGGAASGVTVDFATTNGTALDGVRYTATNGTLTFGSNELSKTFLVGVINDTIPNGDQKFSVQLSNATGGANVSTNAAKNTATLTVLDDESSVTISNFTYTVSESNKFVAITLVRSGALQVSGSVDFTTTNDFSGGPLLPPGLARSGSVASQLSTNDSNVGSQAEAQIVSMETAGIGLATTNDYRSTNGTAVFPPNVKSKTILVPILEDTVVDGTKSFGFQISNPAGGVQLGATANAQIIILDDDLGGALSFSANNYAVSESGTNVLVTIDRSGGLASGVAVDFVLTDDSAVAGVDYSNVSQTVTFNAGETSKQIRIPVFNNTVVNSNKTVLLSLVNPNGGGALGSVNTATLTITDDDLGGTISFARTNYVANENATNFYISVVRTGGKASGVMVDFATVSGTATADQDFNSVSRTLVFAAGETNKIVPVGIINDTIPEGTEFFTVTLANPQGGAALGAFTSATLAIIDDENSISLSNAAVAVGEAAGKVIVTLVRSGALGSTVAVGFATANGSATAGSNYFATNGTVTFPTNVSVRTIAIPIINDSVILGNKDFTFSLLNPVGVQLGTTHTQTITIVEDDVAGEISFSANIYYASEGSTNAVITLVRRHGLASGIAVDFHTADVTAAAGVDYSNATQTVTFNAGETNKKVLIPLINNTVVTDDKFVYLTLDNATGGGSVAEPSAVNLVITEDDLGGTIQFARTNFSAAETASNFLVTVVRTGGKASGVTVDYFTASGTATEDADFHRTTGTLTFAAGETNKTISVGIINDTLAEGLENFKLHLANAGGGGLVGAADTAELVIVDDEASISISNAVATVGEGDGRAIVTLLRSGALNSSVAVSFFTANGSARAGFDYRATNGTVTFSNNISVRTIAIPIVDNTVVGENKTFTFILSNATGGVPLGTVHAQAITIVDNDLGGVINFATNSVAGFQGTNVTVRIIRTGGVAGGVTVPLTFGGGDAIAGIDYINLSPTLTFNAGETSKTILIALPFNAASTNSRSVFVSLGAPGGWANLGEVATAMLTIRYQAEPGTVPAAGEVFFKASVDGVSLSNLVLTVTNYFPNLGTGSPFVEITAQKTENSGTVSNKVIELGFQFLKATGIGPVNFPDASTANGVFFYNVTPNFGVTLLAYSGQFGTGGSVNIDVLNPATKTIAGRFNLVVKELLTGIAHTNTGSFRVRW